MHDASAIETHLRISGSSADAPDSGPRDRMLRDPTLVLLRAKWMPPQSCFRGLSLRPTRVSKHE
jgi:hypothetical protein